MKRVALVAFFVAFAAAGFAQSAGTILVSGGSGYIGGDLFVPEDWTSRATYNLWAVGGYFVADGLEVGPYLSMRIETTKNIAADTTTEYRNAYLGIQTGYYILTGSRIIPFIQTIAAYRLASQLNTSGSITTTDDSWNAIMAQVRGGVDFLLTEQVALSAGALFQLYRDTGPGSQITFYGQVYFGLDVFLGPFAR